MLCDGSADLRLAIQSGGGFVTETYSFTHPLGAPFLLVTGDCRFLTCVGADSCASLREGQLSTAQAQLLSDDLALAALSGEAYSHSGSCLDGGSLVLATRDGSAACTCGCDPDLSARVSTAMKRVPELLAAVGSASAPVRGPVEIVAVELGGAEGAEPGGPTSREVVPWPFAWSLREFAIARERLSADVLRTQRSRIVEGSEASLLRSLRDRSVRSVFDVEVLVDEGGALFAVYVRDAVPPAFAQALDTFPAQNRRHPVALASDEDGPRTRAP